MGLRSQSGVRDPQRRPGFGQSWEDTCRVEGLAHSAILLIKLCINTASLGVKCVIGKLLVGDLIDCGDSLVEYQFG